MGIWGLDRPAEEILGLVRDRVQAAHGLSPERGRE